MRNYNYENKWQKLLTPEIVQLLLQIHEYRGKQTLYLEAKEDILTKLVEVAKIQSTDASNRIEGIYTSDDRLKKIVMNKTMPKSRSEKEIAGYRDVLTTIHDSYQYISIRSSIILQLHQGLYKFSGTSIGGKYKVGDNYIEEVDAEGNKSIRFEPVKAWETSESVDRLCDAYEEAVKNQKIDSLLLIPMFVIDFLCIHPFTDGNGRMSRLLTLLLLYKNDYVVGRYISIENLINSTKESYYDALQQSSENWHEEKNDYEPFVRYMLGMILAAYRDFAERVELVYLKDTSKPDIVRETIKNNIGTITKTELMKRCPGISQTTIQRTLKQLQDSGEIIKLGGGRYTSYTWNREK